MRHFRVRAWVLVAGAAALLSAQAGSALAGPPDAAPAATFAKQGAKVKRLTAAVQMTKDEQGPARAFTGPTSMLADPDNPRVVVAATADLRTRVCHLTRSTDGGHTWHLLAALPAPPTYPYCTTADNAGAAQAVIAWGRNHTLYYALGGYGAGEGGQLGHSSVLLARSTNLGRSWKTTVVDNNRGKGDAPADSGVTGLAVDTSGSRDVVYVGFMQSFPSAPKGSPLQDGAVVVAVSTDGGVHFGAPVNLNDSSQVTQTMAGQSVRLEMMSYFGSPYMTAHDGVVLAVGGPQTPASVTLPGTGYYPMPQLLARSTDHGRTWSVSPLGPAAYLGSAGTGSQTGIGWTPKGGPNGTFVAAYAEAPATAPSAGSDDVVVQRSTDQGRTWSEPVVVNDNRGQGFTSFYPQLGVAPNGRVDIVWEDDRDQHDYRVGAYYTYSTDGGATWAHNVRVSDQPINLNLGISFNSDIRQPPGVASTNQYAAFGWADTRLGDETTQTQDDFSSVAQFSPLPATGSTVAPIVAAVFAGLAVAGLVLVIVLLGRRRREGPNPPRVEQPQPVGAG